MIRSPKRDDHRGAALQKLLIALVERVGRLAFDIDQTDGTAREERSTTSERVDGCVVR